MKKLLLAFWMIAFCSYNASAQQKKHKRVTKAAHTAQLAAKKKTKQAPENTAVISLNSTSANAAYADRAKANNFRIADPTIRWYNMMYDYRHPNGNSVIGIPKLSNGIAHGRIIFYPTSSAGSGSYTGSGSVGTGSSLGSIGTNGSVIGVNGKNPYAGPGIYGSRVLNDMRDKDEQSSSVIPAKKD
jgi:hypothetical protein